MNLSKMTKADLIALVEQQAAELQAAQSGITWQQVVNTAKMVRLEFMAFCSDMYKAGQATRRFTDRLILG